MQPSISTVELASLIAGRTGCVGLDGPNFSGRTDALKAMSRFGEKSQKPRRLYVGSDVHASISTFMPTVREELAFFCEHSEVSSAIYAVASRLGLDACMGNNPFERALSGGQEVILVVLARLALSPELLACDTCLEQLSPQNKTTLYSAVTGGKFGSVSLVVADNRSDVGQLTRTYPIGSIANGAGGRQRTPFGGVNGEVLCVEQRNPINILIDDVSFSYAASINPAIRNASAELRGGRVYALTGDNGSGKSTLAKLLTGLLNASSGSLSAESCLGDSSSCSPSVVGYHFQDPDLQLFETTVELEISSGVRASSRRANTGFVTNIIETFGLTSIRSLHPFDLPFTMRKRLAMAATIAQDRPWVILDEPTLGQDNATCESLRGVVRKLADAGRGVIVISHSPEFLASVADNWLELSGGDLHSRPAPAPP